MYETDRLTYYSINYVTLYDETRDGISKVLL